MVSLPIYIFLFIYFFFLLIFLLFILIDIAHLVNTGTLTFTSFIATFFILSLSVIILWVTWNLLQGTDWQQTITIWNGSWIGNLFNPHQFST